MHWFLCPILLGVLLKPAFVSCGFTNSDFDIHYDEEFTLTFDNPEGALIELLYFGDGPFSPANDIENRTTITDHTEGNEWPVTISKTWPPGWYAFQITNDGIEALAFSTPFQLERSSQKEVETQTRPGSEPSGTPGAGDGDPSSPAATPRTGEGNTSLSTGAKAGIGVGAALAALCLIAFVIWLLRRRAQARARNTSSSTGGEESPDPQSPDPPSPSMAKAELAGQPVSELATARDWSHELEADKEQPQELHDTSPPAYSEDEKSHEARIVAYSMVRERREGRAELP